MDDGRCHRRSTRAIGHEFDRLSDRQGPRLAFRQLNPDNDRTRSDGCDRLPWHHDRTERHLGLQDAARRRGQDRTLRTQFRAGRPLRAGGIEIAVRRSRRCPHLIETRLRIDTLFEQTLRPPEVGGRAVGFRLCSPNECVIACGLQRNALVPDEADDLAGPDDIALAHRHPDQGAAGPGHGLGCLPGRDLTRDRLQVSDSSGLHGERTRNRCGALLLHLRRGRPASRENGGGADEGGQSDSHPRARCKQILHGHRFPAEAPRTVSNPAAFQAMRPPPRLPLTGTPAARQAFNAFMERMPD